MIRPSYWTDADLHTRLNADQREFYVGLWMEADDQGYIRWDVDRIGADLYPYRTTAWRRSHLPGWLEKLDSHIRVLDCGLHIVVVNLVRYQKPPKPSDQYKREHEAICALLATPHGTSGGQVGAPAQGFSKGFSREGVREGKGRGAPAGANGLTTDGEASEFQRRYAATGAPKP